MNNVVRIGGFVLIALGVLVAAAVVLLWSSLFTVHQTQQALILQFGDPKRVIREPGIGFKVPFIQQGT